MRFVKDAVLTFDPVMVEARMEQVRVGELGTTPRVRFADERLWTLVKLLADVVDDRDPSTQLYGDGLTAAIVARLMSRPQAPAREVTGLAPWQLSGFSSISRRTCLDASTSPPWWPSSGCRSRTSHMRSECRRASRPIDGS